MTNYKYIISKKYSTSDIFKTFGEVDAKNKKEADRKVFDIFLKITDRVGSDNYYYSFIK